MTHVFLVCGYGIPKNILKDEHYHLYLNVAFNKIFDRASHNADGNNVIIFCGGKTDMRKPYKRTEAEEMMKYFRRLMTRSREMTLLTAHWKLILERRSLSTLENLLNSRTILKQQNIHAANLFLFCEQTREMRIKKLSSAVFGKRFRICVLPVDFDISSNRYLDSKFLVKKEKTELAHCLWALKSPENLKQHNKLFQEKITYLRNAGQNVHPEAVKLWWKMKLEEGNI